MSANLLNQHRVFLEKAQPGPYGKFNARPAFTSKYSLARQRDNSIQCDMNMVITPFI